MKTCRQLNVLRQSLMAAAATIAFTVAAQPADPGWPQVFKKDGKQLTIYQPQVDYWRGYTNLHFRCAIAIKGVLKQEKYGVAEVNAVTLVDHGARIVVSLPEKRDLRFANVTEAELASLRQAAEHIRPSNQVTTVSLDRVIACLNPDAHPVQRAVELNLNPPTIFNSSTPAILVIFMGEPRFKPVESDRTDLLFALNTNWDVLFDTASRQYYLLNGEGWLTAPDVLKGPWTPATALPPSLYALPADENWAEARKRLPGEPAKLAPKVFVTTEPAELIITTGSPTYLPIQGTRLQRVINTPSTLFLNTGDGKLYLLVAGRWFRGGSLSGPWTAASTDLPPDFAQIQDDDRSTFVKASVPGTREAKDAVLLASIPAKTTVNITNVTLNVTYGGQPQFAPISDTTVQCAVNSPNQVFLVDGSYYCCSQGIWYCATGPSGPWSFSTSVPPAIYTIPLSNPNYNVTYVVVQSSTPTTVTYSETAGYSGEYVATTGVLMFGAGMAVGAAAADNSENYYYYYPPYSCYYSYGCGAIYHYGYGGYYGASYAAYGPYGGAGHAAGYNPYTGTYTRSSYAYGPYGSATRSAAYNPYTGMYAAGGQVNTAYGAAGRVAAYNPTTGNAAVGGYRSTDYGSAGAVKTSQGTGAAAWSTQNSQGAVAKTRSGDVYASNDGTVYRKDSNGNWSQNSGSGWQSVSKPQPPVTAAGDSLAASRQSQASSYQQQRSAYATSAWSQNLQSMESQAQARQWGNRQSQRTSQYQASRTSWGGGVSRGGRR